MINRTILMRIPPIETGILSGDLVFRQHRAGHTPNPNWPYFLAFAEREFKIAAAK